jgi:DNA-binding protein H-NS
MKSPMKELDLEAMPLDDLWTLHERISKLLSDRIIAEKQQLEARLLRLNRGNGTRATLGHKLETHKTKNKRSRRKYPKVFPKYRSPTAPFETWSGRGKTPRWLVSALKSGSKIEDFEIPAVTRGKTMAGY